MQHTSSPVESGLFSSTRAITSKLTPAWLKWLAMAVTASFTSHAAWSLTNSYFYAIAAVILAEGAFLFWEHHVRESENAIQQVIAAIGWVVSILAIGLTDAASAVLMANKAGIFTLFAVIPPWAQTVITYSTVALATIHAVMSAIFHYVSDTDAIKRETARAYRDLDREKRRTNARAELEISRSAAATYLNQVNQNASRIGGEIGMADWERTASHATRTLRGSVPAETESPAPAVYSAETESHQDKPFRHLS